MLLALTVVGGLRGEIEKEKEQKSFKGRPLPEERQPGQRARLRSCSSKTRGGEYSHRITPK